MGYPPSPGYGYPGTPQPNPAGGYPDQPDFMNGYGSTGPALEIHEQRQRHIAAGGDPRVFDAAVAQAAHGYGNTAALDAAQATAGRAEAERPPHGLPRPSSPLRQSGQPTRPTASAFDARAKYSPPRQRHFAPVRVSRGWQRAGHWIEGLGYLIMLIFVVPAFVALFAHGIMLLFVGAFFIGLIVRQIGDALTSGWITRPW
jgi:hypothetical protein